MKRGRSSMTKIRSKFVIFPRHLGLLRSPTSEENKFDIDALNRMNTTNSNTTNTFYRADRLQGSHDKCKIRCVAIKLWVFVECRRVETRDFLFAIVPMRSAVHVFSNSSVRKPRTEKIASGSDFCFVPNKKEWKEKIEREKYVAHTPIRLTYSVHIYLARKLLKYTI